MHRLNLLRFGSDCFSAEASLIWAEGVLFSTNVCNVDWTVGNQIGAYDPLEPLDRSSADNTLELSR